MHFTCFDWDNHQTGTAEGRTKFSWRRQGMAGLIVVVLVLGFMMSVSFSHNFLVQSEIQGGSARLANKKAYCAAFSGLQFTVSRLRQDSHSFLAQPPNNILYFSQNANDGQTHWCTFPSGANRTYIPTTYVTGLATFSCTTGFGINQETDADHSSFILCSYPGAVASQTYWVKSQGLYDADGVYYRCQLWGEINIDASQEIVALRRYGLMRVQPLQRATGALVDDFWDWESF